MRCSTVLIAFCINFAFCYPSKPLNERSTDFLFKTFLENQSSKTENDSPKKITAKSIFDITCQSGYYFDSVLRRCVVYCPQGHILDSHGKCIRIGVLEDNVLDMVLVNLLKEKFSADYYDEELTHTTSGPPLQFNIPLDVVEQPKVTIVFEENFKKINNKREKPETTTEELSTITTELTTEETTTLETTTETTTFSETTLESRFRWRT